MKKLLIDKKDNYAKYVREMHLPVKSKKKEAERLEIIENIKHPVRDKIKYKPSTIIEISKTASLNRSHSLNKTLNNNNNIINTNSDNKINNIIDNNHNNDINHNTNNNINKDQRISSSKHSTSNNSLPNQFTIHPLSSTHSKHRPPLPTIHINST